MKIHPYLVGVVSSAAAEPTPRSSRRSGPLNARMARGSGETVQSLQCALVDELLLLLLALVRSGLGRRPSATPSQ